MAGVFHFEAQTEPAKQKEADFVRRKGGSGAKRARAACDDLPNESRANGGNMSRREYAGHGHEQYKSGRLNIRNEGYKRDHIKKTSDNFYKNLSGVDNFEKDSGTSVRKSSNDILNEKQDKALESIKTQNKGKGKTQDQATVIGGIENISKFFNYKRSEGRKNIEQTNSKGQGNSYPGRVNSKVNAAKSRQHGSKEKNIEGSSGGGSRFQVLSDMDGGPGDFHGTIRVEIKNKESASIPKEILRDSTNTQDSAATSKVMFENPCGARHLLGPHHCLCQPYAEKRGGRNSFTKSGFAEWIQNSEMVDMGFIGARYTWMNKRGLGEDIWERLDRGIESAWPRWLPCNLLPESMGCL
ncbi:hypothetical protein ACOSP7_020699 [Xanthoceras sorbifolium]